MSESMSLKSLLDSIKVIPTDWLNSKPKENDLKQQKPTPNPPKPLPTFEDIDELKEAIREGGKKASDEVELQIDTNSSNPTLSLNLNIRVENSSSRDPQPTQRGSMPSSYITSDSTRRSSSNRLGGSMENLDMAPSRYTPRSSRTDDQSHLSRYQASTSTGNTLLSYGDSLSGCDSPSFSSRNRYGTSDDTSPSRYSSERNSSRYGVGSSGSGRTRNYGDTIDDDTVPTRYTSRNNAEDTSAVLHRPIPRSMQSTDAEVSVTTSYGARSKRYVSDRHRGSGDDLLSSTSGNRTESLSYASQRLEATSYSSRYSSTADSNSTSGSADNSRHRGSGDDLLSSTSGNRKESLSYASQRLEATSYSSRYSATADNNTTSGLADNSRLAVEYKSRQSHNGVTETSSVADISKTRYSRTSSDDILSRGESTSGVQFGQYGRTSHETTPMLDEESGSESATNSNGDLTPTRRPIAVPLGAHGSHTKATPEAATQKALVERYLLSPETKLVEGEFWYEITNDWLSQWKRYVGISKTRNFQSKSLPGAVTTPREHGHHNTHSTDVIHSEGWKQLLSWYGLAENNKPINHVVYTYVRKSEIEKNLNLFKTAVSRSDDGESHMLRFSKMERIGHIEWKIKETFSLEDDVQTRLWARNASGCKAIFDRSKRIGKEMSLDSDFTKCELELEILSGDSWQRKPAGASPSQDYPVGHLDEKSIFDEVATVSLEESAHQEIDRIGHDFLGKLHEFFSDFVASAQSQQSRRPNHSSTAEQTSADMVKLSEERRFVEFEKENIKKERDKLECQKSQLRDEVKQMEELNKISESRVKLDVGGHQYTSSIATLTKDPCSRLASMFSGRHSLAKDSAGCYFIDRDGLHFRVILNYLRNGSISEEALPKDKLNELLVESDYFLIKGLSDYIRSVMKK